MAYNTLQLTHDAGISSLVLNRPDKRNALNHELIAEAMTALDEVAAASEHQVLVLTGAGKSFCAGMDLDDLKSLLDKTPEENRRDSAQIAALFRRIYDFPKPTIAAVNGAAMAGGAGLATMCDFTIAAPNAKFAYTEVRIGFVPALVSAFLALQVGHKTARDLLLTGRQFDANEAQRIGLVTQVVESDELMPRVRELAMQLMANSPSSLRATKQLMNSFIAADLDRQIAEAVGVNASIRSTADFREGVSSFLEKRKPLWSGK